MERGFDGVRVPLLWIGPYVHHLRAVALTRQRRLRWDMEVDDLLHRAVLRWAPGEEPPPEGKRLSAKQVGTFSLACRNVLVDEVRAFARRRRLAEEARHLPGRSEKAVETSLGDRELAERALRELRDLFKREDWA